MRANSFLPVFDMLPFKMNLKGRDYKENCIINLIFVVNIIEAMK